MIGYPVDGLLLTPRGFVPAGQVEGVEVSLWTGDDWITATVEVGEEEALVRLELMSGGVPNTLTVSPDTPLQLVGGEVVTPRTIQAGQELASWSDPRDGVMFVPGVVVGGNHLRAKTFHTTVSRFVLNGVLVGTT